MNVEEAIDHIRGLQYAVDAEFSTSSDESTDLEAKTGLAIEALLAANEGSRLMPVDLTDDTTAIRARSKGVTAWRTEMTADRHWNVIYAQTDLDNDWRIALVSDDDDADFIAHAPTDVAFLLARVEQAEQRLAAVIELHREIEATYQVGEYGKSVKTQRCLNCNHLWPCPTVVLAREGQDGE